MISLQGLPECVPDPRLVPKPRRGIGPPSKYSEDLVARFLACIIEGKTVGAALKQDGIPVKQTILNWTRASWTIPGSFWCDSPGPARKPPRIICAFAF
jgi:hypothetical protein